MGNHVAGALRLYSPGDIIVIDVDECAVNDGGCSPHAYCTNTPGIFTCTCHDGYSGDGFTCSGKTN